VWVGETGWPSDGAINGSAVPSLTNAATYWNQVGCALRKQNVDYFWYTATDDTYQPGENEVEAHFGIAYQNGTLKYSITC